MKTYILSAAGVIGLDADQAPEHLTVTHASGCAAALAASPALGRTRSLAIDDRAFDDACIAAFAAAADLPALCWLDLRQTKGGRAGYAALAKSPGLDALLFVLYPAGASRLTPEPPAFEDGQQHTDGYLPHIAKELSRELGYARPWTFMPSLVSPPPRDATADDLYFGDEHLPYMHRLASHVPELYVTTAPPLVVQARGGHDRDRARAVMALAHGEPAPELPDWQRQQAQTLATEARLVALRGAHPIVRWPPSSATGRSLARTLLGPALTDATGAAYAPRPLHVSHGGDVIGVAVSPDATMLAWSTRSEHVSLDGRGAAQLITIVDLPALDQPRIIPCNDPLELRWDVAARQLVIEAGRFDGGGEFRTGLGWIDHRIEVWDVDRAVLVDLREAPVEAGCAAELVEDIEDRVRARQPWDRLLRVGQPSTDASGRFELRLVVGAHNGLAAHLDVSDRASASTRRLALWPDDSPSTGYRAPLAESDALSVECLESRSSRSERLVVLDRRSRAVVVEVRLDDDCRFTAAAIDVARRRVFFACWRSLLLLELDGPRVIALGIDLPSEPTKLMPSDDGLTIDALCRGGYGVRHRFELPV